MEIKQSTGKKNVYDLVGGVEEIREAVNIIRSMNTAKFDEVMLLDLKINLISLKIINKVESKLTDIVDAVMSSPIVRIPVSTLKEVDDKIENDIYITYTKTKISDENEIKAFSVI